MKILKIFLVILLITIVLSTAITNVLGLQNKITYDNKIILEFSFSKPIIEKSNVDGDIITTVTIEDLPNTHDLGKPILPVKPIRILLPPGTDVNGIKVITSDEIFLDSGLNIQAGGYLVPVSKIVKENMEPAITTNSLVSLYSYVGLYNFRGFSILHINLYPVQYNASNGKISYYTSMKLIVETKNNEVHRAVRNNINDFEIVKNLVDNPETLQKYEIIEKSLSNENYTYLVITNNKLKNSDEKYTFQDLIDFKIDNGISAKIVTTEEIMNNPDFEVNGPWGDANPANPFYKSEITGSLERFNDKPARIRNYIRYAYIELGTEYVLLGGDADIAVASENIIPFRGLFANESGLPLNLSSEEEQDDIPSDVYYACLDGNFNYDCDTHFGESPDRNSAAEIDEADLYAEVWVGRCCADSDGEVSNFVNKTLNYTQSGDPYLSEIMFLGEDLGEAFYFQYGGEYKDLMEYLVPSGYNMHKLYDSDEYTWDPEDFINELYSVQPQIINHDGHGYTNYMLKMGSYNFYELENKKPFFIYSHSCLTGSFDNYVPFGNDYLEEDCIAEILTCEIPYGAYACILNARYGLGSENSPESPSGSYDESFYKALFTKNIKELGKANHYSKEDNIWRINENGYRWAYYETNLFGDPQLRIKEPNSAPNKPTIEGSANGKVGETYDYHVFAIDPDGDDVYYWVQWFEGCPGIIWEGPYTSGEEITFNYTWENRGKYTISVKAKDVDGAVSEITTLEVSIPKIKLVSNFKNLFIQFPRLYLILGRFL